MALILIVDDSPTEVHVMQKALERHGYKTAAAADGAEGVRLAREMVPDLIFMDIVMPGMNGYQATRTLANVRGQLLPIVDLRQFLGSGTTPMTRNTRIIVVNHREIPAGLVVDEVLGFRRFAEGEFSGDAPPTVARCERYLAGAFKRGAEQWPVLSLRQILESTSFSEAAA